MDFEDVMLIPGMKREHVKTVQKSKSLSLKVQKDGKKVRKHFVIEREIT
jgi:hypothetical protein